MNHYDIRNMGTLLDKSPCGCEVFKISKGFTIEYCPKHKAAPDMYGALKAIKDDGKVKANFWKLRHKALAKADET